jgi:hypothetical protein
MNRDSGSVDAASRAERGEDADSDCVAQAWQT